LLNQFEQQGTYAHAARCRPPRLGAQGAWAI